MAEVIPVVDLTDFSSQESPRASPRGSKRPRSEGQDVSLASPVHHHVRKAVHRGERGDVWPPHPEEWGNEDEVEVEVEVAQERSSPLMAVLCTLPGVKPDAVTALLEEGMGVDEAVDRLLSMPGGYPKVPAAEKPAKSEENQDGGKDFSDSSWATSLPYQREAISRLTSDFPTVTTTSVKQVFSAARYHYYFAHRRLTELLAAKTPASGQPESLLQICRVNFISNRRKSKYQPTMDPVLQMELDWMRERELKEQEEKDLAMARELNQDEAERTGNLLECGCCFCEFAFEEMVSCTEGHLFCRSCLARFAKEKVFGQGRCDKVGCMSSDGCEGIFIDDFLSMVLDGPTFRRLQARTCETLAKEVFGDSLFHCPHCDTAAEVPEGVHIFSCPNSACELETCTLCNEPAHVPQRCEEVEKKEETNCRKTVEEAMSEAKIRKCPKCKKRFVKESGCNKMTCTCGAIMCYLCRKPIKGYPHFCQTPNCQHGSCNKCRLFTNDAQDDELAMRDAGLQAKEAAENEGVALKNVDIGNLLEKAPPMPPQAPVARPPYVGMARPPPPLVDPMVAWIQQRAPRGVVPQRVRLQPAPRHTVAPQRMRAAHAQPAARPPGKYVFRWGDKGKK